MTAPAPEPWISGWFGPSDDEVTASARRDLRADAVRAATYLHGEFDEQPRVPR